MLDAVDLAASARIPGAQFSFTDDGHRFQCFITDQISGDLAFLEADHRRHAQVDDRAKTLKAADGDMLPFHAFKRTPHGSSSR